MPDCPDCTDDQHLCFKHKLEYWRNEGSMQLDPRATPTRRNAAPPRAPDPAWERGRVRDPRPDGTSMPLLDESLKPIGVKRYGENRQKYEKRIKELKGS